MDGIAVKPLTVGFHETQFLNKLNGENQLGFWFQLSDQERQQAGSPWGPSNPQALNRYSYVQNNPLRYTDSTGHCLDPISGTLCAIGGAAAAKALADAVIIVVGVGLIAYNTNQMMAASKDNDAAAKANQEKPENPPWEKLQPYRGKPRQTERQEKTAATTKKIVRMGMLRCMTQEEITSAVWIPRQAR